MPNKIEASLPLAQLQAFIEELKAISSRPTLAIIQERAKAYGLAVSLMSASRFRETTFAAHLRRLANGREKSEQILTAVRGGAHPLDAVEESAAADLLDAYTSGEEVDVEKIVKVALALRGSIEQRKDRERLDRDLERRLRESEARMQVIDKNRRIAEERAKKLERERETWEAAQKKVVAATKRLRSAKPKDADAIRAEVVDMLDEALGIKS